MRLQTTIDIYAGGPGSGCHGENCGRPAAGHTPGGIAHDAMDVKEGKLTSSQKKILDHYYSYWKRAGQTVERHGNIVVSRSSSGNTRTDWIDKSGKARTAIVHDSERPSAVKQRGETEVRVQSEFKTAMKGIKLPAGGRKGNGTYSWDKSGGYAGGKTIDKVRDSVVKAGFKKVDDTDFMSPDGSHVRRGDTYSKGNVEISFSKHYGVVKSDNSYSITVRHKDAR